MSKKNKIIFIIIIIAISAGFIFLRLHPLENIKKGNLSQQIEQIPEKNTPTPAEQKNKVETKIFLEVNETKYETNTETPISIYDFMKKLQSENKITFSGKYYSGMGEFVEEINGIKNSDGNYWIYYVNSQKANIGISNYKVNSGDIVSWKYEKISN